MTIPRTKKRALLGVQTFILRFIFVLLLISIVLLVLFWNLNRVSMPRVLDFRTLAETFGVSAILIFLTRKWRRRP